MGPSAVNKQPWRVILHGGTYHFYLKRDKGYISDAVGDMQKIDPGIAVPDGVEYIASITLV